MAATPDPYYALRDFQQFAGQQKALGRGTGIPPEALSRAITANMAAQQDRETAASERALRERQVNLQESAFAANQAQIKRQNVAGAITGAAQLALLTPSAIKGYQDIGWMSKPGTKPAISTTTPMVAPAFTGAGSTTYGAETATTQPFTATLTEGTPTGELMSSQQAAITGQTGAETATIGAGSAALAGAGAGTLGKIAAEHIIRGKYNKWAGILGAGAAGFAVGGPIGAGAGIGIAVAENLFSGDWKL